MNKNNPLLINKGRILADYLLLGASGHQNDNHENLLELNVQQQSPNELFKLIERQRD